MLLCLDRSLLLPVQIRAFAKSAAGRDRHRPKRQRGNAFASLQNWFPSGKARNTAAVSGASSAMRIPRSTFCPASSKRKAWAFARARKDSAGKRRRRAASANSVAPPPCAACRKRSCTASSRSNPRAGGSRAPVQPPRGLVDPRRFQLGAPRFRALSLARRMGVLALSCGARISPWSLACFFGLVLASRMWFRKSS